MPLAGRPDQHQRHQHHSGRPEPYREQKDEDRLAGENLVIVRQGRREQHSADQHGETGTQADMLGLRHPIDVLGTAVPKNSPWGEQCLARHCSALHCCHPFDFPPIAHHCARMLRHAGDEAGLQVRLSI